MSTASSTSPKVLVLVGPTASGKTDLLLELFGSDAGRGLPEAEVISADSMQAYRGMDIGTAKPDAATRLRLPHRLIDIREISEQYTAGDFVKLADEACREVAARGKLPVVSGGTGFYVRNFLCGLPTSPAADPALRAAVAADLASRGAASLREELASGDPESAARIHPNDVYRLTRAVEVLRATGRPMASFAAPTGARPGYEFLVLGVERPRDELSERIGRRVDSMLAAGLEAEARALVAAGCGLGDPGMQAIGYREFLEPGEAPVRDRIVLDTRRYAKRQMTYFRSLPGIRWIPPSVAALEAELRAFLDLPVAC